MAIAVESEAQAWKLATRSWPGVAPAQQKSAYQLEGQTIQTDLKPSRAGGIDPYMT